jgi:hypothetical protein
LDAPHEWVRAWKPAVPGIHEVFHARFLDYVYPRHTHDTWTVFILDEGAITYDLETKHRGAAGARVTILPPHVVTTDVPQARWDTASASSTWEQTCSTSA